MSRKGITQTDLCELTDIPKSAMSQYISGSFKPKAHRTHALAKALNVSEAWLMGYDVSMERKDTNKDIPYPSNIIPISQVKRKKVPLLGDIACGQPIFADETRTEYVLADEKINADFCLKCHGDSMTGARINDGDIVFVRQQQMVDNGEIAAVIIEDEATLKRVYYYPDQGKLVLSAENPKYAPFVYTGEELNQIRILGKAVAFQSSII
ncbi:MAG: helix-turn-helix domain-containing protein [Ruminococcaceae bacterium]|nr:helix-turn-helix domain-containing protein [Oscillospiraceae bacterium]